MRQVSIPLHELAVIAATRGIAGAGLGLLLADQLAPATRRTLGWTLFGIGAATTIPLALSVFRHSEGGWLPPTPPERLQ
jgi:hypothetical protein